MKNDTNELHTNINICIGVVVHTLTILIAVTAFSHSCILWLTDSIDVSNSSFISKLHIEQIHFSFSKSVPDHLISCAWAFRSSFFLWRAFDVHNIDTKTQLQLKNCVNSFIFLILFYWFNCSAMPFTYNIQL